MRSGHPVLCEHAAAHRRRAPRRAHHALPDHSAGCVAGRDGRALGHCSSDLPTPESLYSLRISRRPLRFEDAHARRRALPRAARAFDRRLDLRAFAHPLGHHGLGHTRRDPYHRRVGHALRVFGRREGRGQRELPTVPHYHGWDDRRLRHARPIAARGRFLPRSDPRRRKARSPERD